MVESADTIRYRQMEEFIDDFVMFETVCLARDITDLNRRIGLYRCFNGREIEKIYRDAMMMEE